LRLHRPSARASSTLASTTPTPSSSPTVPHGMASDVPGDAHMLFMCLFIGTSISVGSSSPLLIGRLCHRHHHPRPRLTRRRSGQPIAHVTSPSRDVCRLPQVSSLSMRVVVASPPRAAVRHVVDYVAAAPPRQQRGLSSSSRYVASSGSSAVVCCRPLLLHLHRCRLCRRISCARSELFDTYELRRHTRRWSAPRSSSSSSSTSSTIVTLQWRCRGHSSYVSWLSRRGNFRILDVSPCLPLRLLPAQPCCQRRRLILDYSVYSALITVTSDSTPAILHHNRRGGLLYWSLQMLTHGWGLLPSTCGTSNTSTCIRLQHVSRRGKPEARLVHGGLTASSSASATSSTTASTALLSSSMTPSFCATVTLAPPSVVPAPATCATCLLRHPRQLHRPQLHDAWHLNNGSAPLHSVTSTLSTQMAIICIGYSSRSIRTGLPTVGGYLHCSPVCSLVLLMLRLRGMLEYIRHVRVY
jgi:hypothetical protein